MAAVNVQHHSIGFIGLGLMGSRMVRRLIGAGSAVWVWNRSRTRLREAVANGAVAASTPADVGSRAQAIVLCVTDAAAVEAVLFGREGLSQTVNEDTVVIDTSTIGSEETCHLAGRLRKMTGAHWVDAPVSGGVAGAASGTLAIMAGGSPEDIAKVEWVLAPLARQVTMMGPVGAGQAAKLCNQLIICGVSALIAEAVRLAEQAGIDASLLPEAFGGGYAESVLLQRLVPPMAARDFHSSVGQVATLLKDVELARAMASRLGTSMPVSAVSIELLRALASRGAREISQLVKS